MTIATTVTTVTIAITAAPVTIATTATTAAPVTLETTAITATTATIAMPETTTGSTLAEISKSLTTVKTSIPVMQNAKQGAMTKKGVSVMVTRVSKLWITITSLKGHLLKQRTEREKMEKFECDINLCQY